MSHSLLITFNFHLVLFFTFNVICIDLCKSAGCNTWSGQMSGYLKSGPCPSPGRNGGPINCTQTPTYNETAELGNLWPCPSGNNPNGATVCKSSTPGSGCVPGIGQNPLCNGFNFNDPIPGCCCNIPGCDCSAEFNWIFSTCQGQGCGAYDQQTATQKYKDKGSQLVVNYVASYQYNLDTKQWHILNNSSFNTDGRYPSFDAVKPYGGFSPNNLSSAWLQPQPGGSNAWNWGYYPAGVKGIQPPAGLFILSTEQSWNFAFYMLNQITLDRGPIIPYPKELGCNVTNDNCWETGNAGEMDFLESPWAGALNDNGAADQYRRLFSTQSNQVGRCFPGEKGQLGHSFGDFGSTSYFLGSPPNQVVPYIWAVVVDSVGFFMYRIPSDQASTIWPGLTRTTSDCTLQQKPSVMPKNLFANSPCNDTNSDYCALFVPNCPSNYWGGANQQGANNQGCWQNNQQGWCGNWWTFFNDTNQWLWPINGTKAVLHYANADPVTQKWNVEMECKLQPNV